MSDKIVMRTGEATVFASAGQFTDAMPEIVIGQDGPVGAAFANLMGQTAGHTRMFAVRDCNQMARPATADAVVHCVADGIIPRDQVNELCIIDLVWLDPQAVTDPDLDQKDLYRTNYEATRLAISRAMNNEPSIDELIANRHKIRHCMYDPDA